MSIGLVDVDVDYNVKTVLAIQETTYPARDPNSAVNCNPRFLFSYRHSLAAES
jgi:hypothetical protein